MIPVVTTPDDQITRALRESIQIPPSVTRDGVQSGFSASYERSTILPPRGTRARELELQRIYFMDEMHLIRGAMTGLAKNVASLPWEIKGDKTANSAYGDMARSQGWRLKRDDGVNYFQEVFRQANFGQGWGTFIAQTVLDFLRYDAGAYIEVIAPGDAFDKPIGPIVGLAHLDPLYTYPTGDPRYPAIYYDRWGGLHVLNYNRVIRLLDMDDGDQRRPGYGDSALSRSISIALGQVYQTRYVNTRLDDSPPPGLTIIGGIMKTDWAAEQQKYRAQQTMDGRPTYGQRQFYFTMDAAHMPKIESYDFSSPPEKFDYRVYTDIAVDLLANAMGIDRLEIMQLSGSGNIGSQGQSSVLSQKSRGKTLGFLLQQLERKLNDCLPDEYTFEFKTRDNQESMEDAQKAQAWAGVGELLVAQGAITAQEARTLVANEIEGVSDALQDSTRANDVINRPIVAEDNTVGSAPVTPTNAPDVRVNVDEEVKSVVKKSYDVTEAGFIQDLTDLLKSAITPNPYLDRRGFNITLRSFLKNYGYMAYKDGLAQGGVYVETLDPEDNADYMTIFVDQSQYVPGLSEDVYVTKSITNANVYNRANMWGKSLQAFLNGGLTNANKNAMYKWRRGLTSDSCETCRRLDGQVHRIRNWKARGLLPRSGKLKCLGFQCLCRLERTNEIATGRF